MIDFDYFFIQVENESIGVDEVFIEIVLFDMNKNLLESGINRH